MDDFRLLIDLHKHALRQGPGGDAETTLALDLCMLDKTEPLKIADIGCGTGASTLTLARQLNATITAVDFLREFLDVLENRATKADVSEKISTLQSSMENLPFDVEEYDMIWSEGAIYNIGFEKGINDWRRYLKPGGLMVASEITWTTGGRPSELQHYWDNEYPEIDVASSNISILEKCGYSPIGYFVLPEHCWTDNYYTPMQERFDDFLRRNGNTNEARAIVESETKEIKLYNKYKDYISYGMYVASKQPWS
ncbi:class I SAM-dependent methyltransferase [Rhodohalobacter sulfatireducens]|uniref:Methyltransferase domain-containing protein n=1 Tax=Rhodohalobacter sulfatireducens TaxID=2911366 RepID=A0ABS9KJ89_9BACT|nr:class I SAM-dependent methyltransferase [Rhodohalobacter sulfatireducens]MCG2590910.1 methyltransferase domain-containing protein [Rhodohalobacter sulfatireducens]